MINNMRFLWFWFSTAFHCKCCYIFIFIIISIVNSIQFLPFVYTTLALNLNIYLWKYNLPSAIIASIEISQAKAWNKSIKCALKTHVKTRIFRRIGDRNHDSNKILVMLCVLITSDKAIVLKAFEKYKYTSWNVWWLVAWPCFA